MSDFSITGAILAGGKGQRMGGVNKGLLIWADQPLVMHVHQAMEQVVEDISFNTNDHLEAYQVFRVKVISDQDHQNKGPLSGIFSCLQEAQGSHLLISPCDTPCISPQAFKVLLESAQKQPDCIVYLSSESGDHPLHGVIPKASINDLERYLQGNRFNVMGFYQVYGAQAVDWPHESELLNINTQQCLASLTDS
ncbi:molybdenum cofactor guanylyltransferase [Marinomonas sp.]